MISQMQEKLKNMIKTFKYMYFCGIVLDLFKAVFTKDVFPSVKL